MKKWILAAAVCLLLTGCGDKTSVVGVTTVQKSEEGGTPATSIQSITVAPLGGQPQSPDGKYTVRLEGVNEGVTAAGLDPSECIRIVETDSGDVVWETDGAYTVAVQWSSDGKYAAIARAARTWEEILVVETERFEAISVTLPDGSTLGEYHFVEDMVWTNRDQWDHRLYFSTRAEDGKESSAYLFIPNNWYDELTGDTFYAEIETLSKEYDFSQDGEPEEVSLVTVIDPNGTDVSWYELWVAQEGETYLREEFSTAHAGYNSILACKKDGRDYIYRYRPGFGMGYGYYGYQLLTLGAAGETVAEQGSVEFDANFHHPNYSGPFDAAAIADFLKQARALMEQSTLLFSTEGGVVRRGMSGGDFFPLIDTYFELPADSALWEQYLREFAGEITTLTSPDGRYQARAVQNLNSCSIYVTNLSTQETISVKLPDGSFIPADTKVDEMRWVTGAELWPSPSLWLLLEQDGKTTDYRYNPASGQTHHQMTTILDGTYDFDHDGVTELVEVDGLYVEYTDKMSLFEVRLLEQGEYIWVDDAHTSHVGWNTVLACKVEGQDYLLQYHPYMSTGLAGYSYQLFSLDESGNEVTKAENSVSFDVNMGSTLHEPMDAAAIAAFLQEVYGYLETSTLLMSTEDGRDWESVSGTDFFRESLPFDLELPNDQSLWEQAIRDYEAEMTAARAGQ